jgi:hypothetical protein
VTTMHKGAADELAAVLEQGPIAVAAEVPRFLAPVIAALCVLAPTREYAAEMAEALAKDFQRHVVDDWGDPDVREFVRKVHERWAEIGFRPPAPKVEVRQ